jgi:hypothetical protein
MLSRKKKRKYKDKKVHEPNSASLNTQMTSIEKGSEVLQP